MGSEIGTIWDAKRMETKYLFSIKINSCILPKCHSGQYSHCDVSVLSKEIKAKIKVLTWII